MDINLYTFSKRLKSTARPTGSGTTVSGYIRNESGISNFTISIDFGPTTNPHIYNYAYIADYERYYWASEWTWIPSTGFWECSFSCDPYASAKNDILNTSAYVLYDTHSNIDIVDDRIPWDKDISISTNSAALPITLNSTGKYIMTVVNSNGVEYYDLPPTVLKTFLVDIETWLDDLWNGYTPDFSTIENALSSICDFIYQPIRQLTASGNVMENVKSCIWLPLDPASGNVQNIKAGKYTSNLTAPTWIYSAPFTNTITIAIPWLFSDWRNKNSSVYLYLPFVGNISLVADNLIGYSSLSILWSLDYMTGDMSYEVKCGTNVIGVYKTNIAVEVPIGTVSVSSVAPFSAGAGAMGVAAKAGAGFAGAIASGMLAALVTQEKTTNSSAVGSLTGRSGLGLDLDIKCTVEAHNTLYNPHNISATLGEPRHQVMQLSNCSGYVQTVNAQVAGAWTDQELAEINSGLDGGIYLE